MNIFLDIETLPTANPSVILEITEGVNEQIGHDICAVRPPSNYGPEAAAKWMVEKGQPQIDALKLTAEKQVDEAIRKTGLSGLFGQVCVIGFAVDDEPVQTFYDAKDEPRILSAAFDALKGHNGWDATTVGHNVSAFDLRFIVQRSMVHGIKPPMAIMRAAQAKPWETEKVFDTMVQWAGVGNRVSLDKLCRALGIKSPKGDIEGSQVYDYVKAGKIKEVAEYCAADVVATREVWKRLTWQG